MKNIWTIKSILDWTATDFQSKGIPSARLEAELILSYLLNVPRIKLYTDFDRPLLAEELQNYKELIKRRRNGECTAYIVGKKEFWSLDFIVTPDVLVPRSDTEILVETTLSNMTSKTKRILDMCTGSGCVAASLATERTDIAVVAVDVSKSAVNIAKQNFVNLSVNERITLLCGNLFEPIIEDNKFDVIVSNPPYVIGSEIDSLSSEVKHEPRLALDGGGEDGLDFVRKLLSHAKEYLNSEGKIILEVGCEQAHVVAKQLGPELLAVEGQIIKDLAGLDRVVLFKV